MKTLKALIQEDAKSEFEALPHVSELGDGTWHGELAGCVFRYEGKYYRSDIGIRQSFPAPFTVYVKNSKQVSKEDFN